MYFAYVDACITFFLLAVSYNELIHGLRTFFFFLQIAILFSRAALESHLYSHNILFNSKIEEIVIFTPQTHDFRGGLYGVV